MLAVFRSIVQQQALFTGNRAILTYAQQLLVENILSYSPTKTKVGHEWSQSPALALLFRCYIFF
jgi:hypothetical protein